MLTGALPPLAELLAAHDLAGVPERSFANDGWSGSELTALERHGRRFVLKRTSPRLDWIVRATADTSLRESWLAMGPLDLPPGITAAYLGAASDGDAVALLMPDLSDAILTWDRTGSGALAATDLDRVLAALADLHASTWWPPCPDPPWCSVTDRVTLLTRAAAQRYTAEGLAVGARFAEGWDAFERRASRPARELLARLSADPSPLVRALGRLPAAGLHGDLKLANVALPPSGEVALIDWQMTLRAPVAVELGWLLVANVASLPSAPDDVLRRYAAAARTAGVELGDWAAQVDLAWLVGLLLRGWRKGLDAEAGTSAAWGASGADELAWWCDRTLRAADRRL